MKQAALALGLLLLTCSPAIAADPGEALREAARRGDVAAARELLAAGTDADAANDYGATAVSYAADKGDVEILRLLLEHGADPNVHDSFYDATPVTWASYNGHAAAVVLLLEAGAEDVTGAMTMAIFRGHPEVLKAILGTGKVAAEAKSQALGIARESDAPEMVRLLEKAGAKPPPPATGEAAEARTAESEGAEEPAEEATEVEEEAVAEAKPPQVPRGAADRDWPAFRGPGAAGTANGSPPVAWDVESGENVAFATAIPGRGHSSPIVWGDRLYVTTAVAGEDEGDFRHGLYGDVDVVDTSETEYSWRLYALDKKSGEILWQRVAHEGKPRSAHHMKATQVNSTPATDGRHLVALMGSEGLFCWSPDGALKWRRDLGELHVGWFYDPSYEWGHASSPTLYEDLVIVQADLNRDPFIAAYSLADGREVWRTARENRPSWGTPTIVHGKDRVELVTNGSRHIRAYDPRDGKQLWWLTPNSEVTVGTPVTGHGLVFVVASYRPIRPIYAIRPGGRGDISLPEGAESSDHIAWWTERGGTYMPTPIVYGDHLYTSSNNGVLGCYDARSGERLYRERIAGKAGTAFTASPVAAAGRLYLSSEDGDIFVVRAGTRFERLAANPMGGVVMATPAISENMLYVRTMGHLYGLGEPEAKAAEAGK